MLVVFVFSCEKEAVDTVDTKAPQSRSEFVMVNGEKIEMEFYTKDQFVDMYYHRIDQVHSSEIPVIFRYTPMGNDEGMYGVSALLDSDYLDEELGGLICTCDLPVVEDFVENWPCDTMTIGLAITGPLLANCL